MTVQLLLSKINEYEISVAYLARKTGMHRSTFNNKLKGNNGSKFTDAELIHVEFILDQMARGILKKE